MGLPLRLGIGLSHVRSDEVYAGTDGPGDVGAFREDATATTLGLGVETTGPARLAFGGALRRSATRFENDALEHRDAVFSADVGVLGTVDVVRLAGIERARFAPVATVSAGYALRNLGSPQERVSLLGDRSTVIARPLDRRAALGLSWEIGYDVRIHGDRIPAFRLRSANEADASLVRSSSGRTDDYTYSYASAFSRLDLGDALRGWGRPFERSYGEDCTVVSYNVGHSSNTFEVGGVLAATFGVERLDREPAPLLRSNTWGLGLDVGGALRLAGALRDDARLRDAGKRTHLRLDYANLDRGFPGSSHAVTLTAGWAL